ncbi:MAG: tRNA (5-methylaminomethyl-2-thiouridine)(34)-methyltransferase MnmD [Pseudomonadota bacterium]
MNDDIIWDETETPVSRRFDDPYYSKRDGRAETRHVFIDGNDVERRWLTRAHFHIAELGFGTGLNFFETVKAWRASERQDAQLTYISFELYPLTADDIARALAPWPDLAAIAEPFLRGLALQTDDIEIDDVSLKLIRGDANGLVKEMSLKADAWYLDGFSPAKNPELWNCDLMCAVYDKTAPGGTFATYTAAGWVRRMLEEAGFVVERREGFATKRHMTVGRKPD